MRAPFGRPFGLPLRPGFHGSLRFRCCFDVLSPSLRFFALMLLLAAIVSPPSPVCCTCERGRSRTRLHSRSDASSGSSAVTWRGRSKTRIAGSIAWARPITWPSRKAADVCLDRRTSMTLDERERRPSNGGQSKGRLRPLRMNSDSRRLVNDISVLTLSLALWSSPSTGSRRHHPAWPDAHVELTSAFGNSRQ